MAELKIKADSGGGTVSLKGPATTTSNAAVQLTLPVDDGSADQYLKTNGSGVLSWAAAGGGKVLQVTRATTENQYNPGANATWGVIAAPQASITPAATSSKIFVIVNAWALVNNPSNFGQRIQRSISGGADTDLEGFWSESGVANWVPMNCATIILDSPNTTSAVTYKIKLYANANYTNFRWNYDAGVAPEATASMTLVEIGA